MKKSLMVDLKNATAACHKELHDIPYFKTIMNETLAVHQYASHLRSLAVIWTSLEHQLYLNPILVSQQLPLHLGSVWPAIEKDLKALGGFEQNPTVVLYSLDIVSSMLISIVEEPVSIIGFLYVMLGSLNGNERLAGHIDVSLKYSNATHYMRMPLSAWSIFGNAVDEGNWEGAKKDAIVQAAVNLFQGLQRLFSLISTSTATRAEVYITSINPEAGNHPMPANPNVISAAIRAGLRAWARYPYLKRRYGERGMRFAKSDSCWLATLPEKPQNEVNDQVLWLARLLSSRGIPSVILETHLTLLGEELLTASNVNAKNDHIKLTAAADSLRYRRRKIVSDEEFERMTRELDVWFSQIKDFPKNSGAVFISALVDEIGQLTDAKDIVSIWYLNNTISKPLNREFQALVKNLKSRI